MSLWERVAAQFEEKTDYLAHPTEWAQERLSVEPWSKQREILESVRDNPDTMVQSCHSAGKSWTAALTVAWWLDSHPPGEAFVLTTAPTGDQVKAILWREIGRMHKRGALPGRTNLTEWYIDDELVALGRKPNDYEPTAFQGIHAIFLLVVLDEACGIPKMLWEAASTLTSNQYARTLAIGNPDDPHGEFSRQCRPGMPTNVIKISAYDTPNFTGEDVSDVVRASLISRDWAEKKKIEWGPTSPLYQSKVLGEFPTDSETGTIPLSFVQRCREIELPETQPVEAGLDVGGGGDRTVLRERRGWRCGRERIWTEADPMKSVGQIVEVLNDWGIQRVKVDVNGIGWGLAGRLKELSLVHGADPGQAGVHSAEVVDCNFGAGSSQPERFLNLRAEIYWEVGREYSRLQRWDLSNIDDDVAAELTASKYEILDSKGKIKIEKKDEIKKRLGVSPDRSDALLMAYWSPYTTTETMDADVLFAGRIPGVRQRR